MPINTARFSRQGVVLTYVKEHREMLLGSIRPQGMGAAVISQQYIESNRTVATFIEQRGHYLCEPGHV
jgi:hypothetical protein